MGCGLYPPSLTVTSAAEVKGQDKGQVLTRCKGPPASGQV